MTIPALSLTVQDPGLGLADSLDTPPLVAGCSSLGTVGEVVSVSTPAAAVAAFGQGPLVEDLCRILALAGGPIDGVRLTGGTAAACSAVTAAPIATGTGTITVAAQVPLDSYSVRVEITGTGTVGVGKFRYSLDGGINYSADITIPSGGTYLIANTAITMTFVPGAGAVFFEVGDVHTFTCTAPHFTATNLSDGLDLVFAGQRYHRFILLAGQAASGSAGATIAATFASKLTAAAAVFRYTRGLMNAGTDTKSNVQTAYVAFADRRIGIGFDTVVRASLKPFTGWATPVRTAAAELAARMAADLISTHAGRVASGPLDGVVSIAHDENASNDMDSLGFATLRTWPLVNGFYPTRGRIKAPMGSDFQRFELGFIMDAACSSVVRSLTLQANKTVRTLTDGSGKIDPLDAADWREVAMRGLRNELTQPANAEGTRGHVSGLDVTVDLTNDVLTTGEVIVYVAIVSLGYVEQINIKVGYATNI